MTKEYDLVVLGGGTGGYVAAIRASQLGMKVALVEADKLGGTCLHRGCIPSKTLLRTAELSRQLQVARDFGVNVSLDKIDFEKTQHKKDAIINQLHTGIQALIQKNQIDLYQGYGRILGPSIFSPLPGTISVEYAGEVENTMIVPKYVLIATGSSPKVLKGLEFDGEFILSSDDALAMKKLPSSMIIVGGGVIGIEWASLLVDLGVEVTVVEVADDVLLQEDEEIRREVKKQLKQRGVKFYTKCELDPTSVSKSEDLISFNIHQANDTVSVSAEKVLVSIGRKPNIEDIGLQNTNIETERGYIKTDAYYRTKDDHIYAIGDCVGGLQLAHVASEEARIAVEHMAGKEVNPLNEDNVPINLYAHPEVAKIGLTEKEAKAEGKKIKIGKFPFQGIGKAHVHGETAGFVKIITDADTEDLLGIHIVGPQATELIAEASIAKLLDATAWEIGQTIHAHPSLAEVLKEAALAVEGVQIHG